MQTEQGVSFGPYRLAGPQGPLFRYSQEVSIPPKALAVLWLLVSRAGAVVTKEELLSTVWAGTVVGEEALTSCLRRLRRALREETEHPHYIATVHRIGYRFIEKIVTSRQSVVSRKEEARGWRLGTSSSSPQASSLKPLASPLVGREAELTQFHNLFAKMLNGERQVVFVTGEAGIGKTSLIETFVQSLASRVQSQEEENQKSKACPACAGAAGTGEPSRRSKNQKAKIPSRPLAPNTPHLAPVFIAQGQCIEHYGAGEAYLPLLEAVSGLCRRADGAQVLDVLRRVAPTWLVQLPALLTETDYAALQQKTAGATRERMLREMVEALEILSTERVLVLVLEDVHWSDASTIDVLNLLARRREPARLLVVATYRPAEAIVSEHPLKRVKQELVTRGQGVEVALGPLGADSVQRYVRQRWGAVANTLATAAVVYRRTEGHPLFMVQLIDYLMQHDTEALSAEALDGVERLIPQQLRQLLEVQVEQLTAQEQQVLEVGSVAGVEFTIAGVAAGLGGTEKEVETVCELLAQRGQFIAEHEPATWPDGTVSGRYGFRHALYQEVLYQRVSASRRARLHRQIGEQMEAGYGDRAKEMAAELAVHFERGRDTDRTVLYLQQAGENALRRSAHQEASSHLTKGLELLKTLLNTPTRAQRELALQLALGRVLMATKGYAAPEVEKAYTRALELCRQMGETPQIFRVLYGLRMFYLVRAQHKTAQELAEQLLTLAQRVQDPALLLQAHYVLGTGFFFLGEFVSAREKLERVTTLYDPQQHNPYTSGTINDIGVGCRGHAGWVLWFLGYPEQALKRSQEALALARGLSHPLTLATALYFVASVHQIRRDVQLTRERAEEAIAFSTEQGFAQLSQADTILRGWALARQGQGEEGIAQIRRGLAAFRATGAEYARPFALALLAEAYGCAGRPDEGLCELTEVLTLVEATGERWYEAELYRLKGELTLQQLKMKDAKDDLTSPQASAEEYFLKAIEVARRQQAKSLELRAVMSLVRLRQRQVTDHVTRPTQHESREKLTEAHTMLSEVYGWFTEGFDTKDLQEAKALLETLSD